METSSERCSCALSLDGGIVSRSEHAPRRHAERILPMVDEVLREAGCGLADLDAIAFGRGPGSFTGLRIAAGVVQGLAWGSARPVAPVSSLHALAWRAWRERGWRRVACVLDARMGEVYAGFFSLGDDGCMRAIGAERVCAPAALGDGARDAEGEPWSGVGSGFAAYPDALAATLALAPERQDPALEPDAVDVVHLAAAVVEAGQTVPASSALPVYLRNDVAARPARVTAAAPGRAPAGAA